MTRIFLLLTLFVSILGCSSGNNPAGTTDTFTDKPLGNFESSTEISFSGSVKIPSHIAPLVIGKSFFLRVNSTAIILDINLSPEIPFQISIPSSNIYFFYLVNSQGKAVMTGVFGNEASGHPISIDLESTIAALSFVDFNRIFGNTVDPEKFKEKFKTMPAAPSLYQKAGIVLSEPSFWESKEPLNWRILPEANGFIPELFKIQSASNLPKGGISQSGNCTIISDEPLQWGSHGNGYFFFNRYFGNPITANINLNLPGGGFFQIHHSFVDNSGDLRSAIVVIRNYQGILQIWSNSVLINSWAAINYYEDYDPGGSFLATFNFNPDGSIQFSTPFANGLANPFILSGPLSPSNHPYTSLGLIGGFGNLFPSPGAPPPSGGTWSGTVCNQPPSKESLKILSPQSGAIFDFGSQITFTGEKVGDVQNIRWVADNANEFAQGLNATATFSVGTHTIILKGNIGSPSGQEIVSESIAIQVLNPNIQVILNPTETRPGAASYAHWMPNPGSTTVTVRVSGQNGTVISSYSIILSSVASATSGGHRGPDHDSQRPLGLFFTDSNNQGAATIQGFTNFLGELEAEYRPSQMGGFELIYASAALNLGIGGFASLTVRIPNLELLETNVALYTKTGGTQSHFGPNDRRPEDNSDIDENHYGTAELIQAIQGISTDYNLNYRRPSDPLLAFNDMSLPFGGKFDDDGEWVHLVPMITRPGEFRENDHREHRLGIHVDFRFSGLPRRVKDILNNDLIPNYFTIPPGRTALDFLHGQGSNRHWHISIH